MPGYSDLARRSTGLSPAATSNSARTPTGRQSRPTSVGANASSRGSGFGAGGSTPSGRRNPVYHAAGSNTPVQQQPQQQRRTPSNYRGNMKQQQQPQPRNMGSSYRSQSGGGGGSLGGTTSSMRSDSVSANLFQTKLAEMTQVREQIEVLARKHRDNEQSLSDLVVSILNIDESHREKTKNELLGIVQERDNTIQMLEVFRQEGNAIIRRLHDNLKKQVGQNELTLRELHSAQRELAAMRAGGGGSEHSGTRSSPESGIMPATQVEAEDLRRRCSEYAGLLREGDNITGALKLRVDQLARQLTDAGLVPHPPDQAQMRRMRGGGGGGGGESSDNLHHDRSGGDSGNDNSGRAAGNSDDDDGLMLGDAGATPTAGLGEDDLRDRLRMERRARLETEEKSHQVYIQQQKQIRLLEQRISGMQKKADQHGKDERGGALTPRGGGGGGSQFSQLREQQQHQQNQPQPLPTVAVTPPQQQQKKAPSPSNDDDSSPNIAGMINNMGATNLSSSQRSGRSGSDSPTGNPEEDTQMLEDIEKQLQHVYESLESS